MCVHDIWTESASRVHAAACVIDSCAGISANSSFCAVYSDPFSKISKENKRKGGRNSAKNWRTHHSYDR